MMNKKLICRNTIAVIIAIITITISFPIWAVVHCIKEIFNWNAYVEWYSKTTDMLMRPMVNLYLRDNVKSENSKQTLTD